MSGQRGSSKADSGLFDNVQPTMTIPVTSVLVLPDIFYICAYLCYSESERAGRLISLPENVVQCALGDLASLSSLRPWSRPVRGYQSIYKENVVIYSEIGPIESLDGV